MMGWDYEIDLIVGSIQEKLEKIEGGYEKDLKVYFDTKMLALRSEKYFNDRE